MSAVGPIDARRPTTRTTASATSRSSAPGGWFRDGFGTPTFQTPGNLILSSYPLDLAIEEGLADAERPADRRVLRQPTARRGRRAAFYTYLQGTSMASPHAAGVAALIIEAHGQGNPAHGYSLAPDTVRSILEDGHRPRLPGRRRRDLHRRGPPGRLERRLRRHHRRQRPLRRGHHQRHRRRRAAEHSPANWEQLVECGRLLPPVRTGWACYTSTPDREAGPVRPARTGGRGRWPNENAARRPRTGAFSLPGPG